MHRRQWMTRAAFGTGALGVPFLLGGPPARAQARAERGLKITDVKTVLTAPAGIRLVVVKVTTNEPGLYGLGCATFTQRARVVETAVDRYLKPFLLGKDPLQIEDVFQSSFVSSYWRNGPVLGNALSGVDMALWDILGKRANMPVYQLLGGKCREAVDTYAHTKGRTFQEVEKAVRAAKDRGFRNIRVQISVPGQATYGVAGGPPPDQNIPVNRRPAMWEPGPYVRLLPKLF